VGMKAGGCPIGTAGFFMREKTSSSDMTRA
jgi:hypothetical protein